jgi:hypothetical protein
VGSCATSPCAPLSVEDGNDDNFDFDWDSDEDAGGREPNSDEVHYLQLVIKFSSVIHMMIFV